MIQIVNALVPLLVLIAATKSEEIWKPTSWNHCRTNADCQNPEKLCCSITASLGKRRKDFTIPEYVHYCLPYKTKEAVGCDMSMQYNESTPHYFGLCPCGPGLRCVGITKRNSEVSPRDSYGKCQPVS